jgi:chorismate lyase / 3-hydroxybenzoate synthase
MRGRRAVMPKTTVSTPIAFAPLAPIPPSWVDALVGPAPAISRSDALDGTVEVRTGATYTHVAITIPTAHRLPPDRLHDHVRDAYLSVAATLNVQQRHPVRFWNFVPHIHTPAGPDLDRYMIFNAGRFAACEHWHGSPNDFDHTLAAASGVGVLGEALAIHCLAAEDAGEPIENPRQVPAYKYSRRYGPRPPCFARATRLARQVGGAWWLLVAGTASIRGEQTVHVGDIGAQTIETLDNLDALLAAAEDRRGAIHPRPRFTSLRIYLVRPDDAAIVRERMESRYGHIPDIEYAQAELCRTDLLVEVEGIAEF